MTGLPLIVRWRKAILASSLPAAARHVGHVLGEHADADGGSCFPSIVRLAEETGYAESTIRAAVASLERLGFVHVTRTRGGRAEGGLGLRNAYRLIEPPDSRRVGRRRVARSTPRPSSKNPPTIVEEPPDHRRGSSPTTGPTTGPPKRAPSATRRRDPIFDALVEACGLNYADMTERERRACGVAAAELGRLDPPPDRDAILRRAGRWPEVFGEATCTPNAVARHWAQLGAERPADRNARDIAALARSLGIVPGGEAP